MKWCKKLNDIYKRYLFFKVIHQISRSSGSTNRWNWPKLGVSGLWLQFEFAIGKEMIHNAWSSIEELPYCFSRSFVKFRGHRALKIIECDLNGAFPHFNSSLNSPMATKRCTKLLVALKRCPFVYQGHASNCKVTRLKKIFFFTHMGRFRTVTPVWIHQWLWNDTQSLK